MNPKISIILPVYRVENFIEKCVRSLFCQTMVSEMEFIFIDDKSPDGSIAIVEKLAQEFDIKKDQLKIIRHHENKGVSQSRQDGLEAASGEYIIHCDPDDWVETDMYEKLYVEARRGNFDMVICDYIEAGKEKINVKQDPKEYTSENIIKGITDKSLYGSTWNKLIRREIAQNYSFIPGITVCEDALYLFNVLSISLKISYIEGHYYNYRVQNTQSVTKQYGSSAIDNDLKLFNELKKLGDKYPQLEPYAEQFAARHYIDRLYLYDSPWSRIKELRSYNHLLKKDVLHSRFHIYKTSLILNSPSMIGKLIRGIFLYHYKRRQNVK